MSRRRDTPIVEQEPRSYAEWKRRCQNSLKASRARRKKPRGRFMGLGSRRGDPSPPLHGKAR